MDGRRGRGEGGREPIGTDHRGRASWSGRRPWEGRLGGCTHRQRDSKRVQDGPWRSLRDRGVGAKHPEQPRVGRGQEAAVPRAQLQSWRRWRKWGEKETGGQERSCRLAPHKGGRRGLRGQCRALPGTPEPDAGQQQSRAVPREGTGRGPGGGGTEGGEVGRGEGGREGGQRRGGGWSRGGRTCREGDGPGDKAGPRL